MCSRILLSLTVALLTALPIHAQEAEVPRTRTLPGIASPAFPYAQPEDVGLSSEKLAQLGDEITGWVANGELVGAELLIVKDGRAVFHEAYGWADREEGRPMERGSLFSIQSMSKSYAATAVLMLAEEGRLSLADPVSRYIAGFPDDRTTLHHLLSHTSGFFAMQESDHLDPSDFESLRDWAETLVREERKQPLGAFGYTDYNYIFLGQIVEEVSGFTIEAFIEEHILRPLSLHDTFTAFSPDAAWAERMNSRYRWNDEARAFRRVWTRRDEQPWPFYPVSHGLYTTAMDYAAFMGMWMGERQRGATRLLSEAAIRESLRVHGVADPYRGYGYGWVVRHEPPAAGMLPTFYHGGSDGTLAVAFPAAGAMVVFLSHTQSRAVQNALGIRLGMLEVFDPPGPYATYLARAGEQEVEEVALTPEQRTRYVGSYRDRSPEAEGGPGTVVRVWEEDGRLHIRMGELGQRADVHRHLVPLGDHGFALGRYRRDRLEAIDLHGRVRFVVEDDRATALEATAGGRIQLRARRAAPEQILAEIEAERSRVAIDEIVLRTLEADGVNSARAIHRVLQSSRPDSVRFGESLLGTLGYRLLDEGRVEEAAAVFEMNVEAFPEAPRAHGALADAYAAGGRLEDARRSFARAVELAEEQGDENVSGYRARLERVTRQLEGER